MAHSLKLLVATAVAILVTSTSYGTVCAADGGVAPPQCALEETKAQHPDWYRDGGYCELYNGHQPNFVEPLKCTG